jgi:hypothetical protein
MLAVWRGYGHPKILFSTGEIDGASIIVDPRERIILPKQTDAWTDQDCNDAYRILAHVDYSDVEPGCMAGLMCQYIGQHELTAISAKWGAAPVPFSRPTCVIEDNRPPDDICPGCELVPMQD